MSALSKVILTVIISAGVVGGGTYYFMNQKLVIEKKDKDAKIAELQTQVAVLQQTSTNSAVDSANPDTTSSLLETYKNSTYSYSVQYPKSWTLKNEERFLSINSPDNQIIKEKIDAGMYGEGYSPTVSIEYFASVSDYVNYGSPQATSTKTLYEYIQGQAISGTLKEITLGGKKAYEYEAGGLAGTYYNITCEFNSHVYSITIVAEKKLLSDAEKAIITSFQFVN